MKKLLFLLLLFVPFWGFSQLGAGDYIDADTTKVKGESLIYPAPASGEYYYKSARDPSDSLDVVNLRSLLRRLAELDSLGLLVSDMVSGDTTVNTGETQIYFPSQFDTGTVVVVPYVRRLLDNAVIDYSINDVDSMGFDIVVWEDNIKVYYVASNRATSNFTMLTAYVNDSSYIKQAIRDYLRDSANYVWFKDTIPTIATKYDLTFTNRRSNVRYWGAKGDGITLDSAAFRMAFDSCQFVYVPSGTYLVGNITVKRDNFALMGDGEGSILKFITGATGTMIDCDSFAVTIKNIALTGSHLVDYRSTGSTGLNRNGIALKSSRKSVIENISVEGFENRGVWLDDATTATLVNRIKISLLDLKYNWIGLETGLNGELHFPIIGVYAAFNRYGILGGAGNLNVQVSTLNQNYYGFYADGTRLNDGHGNVSNSIMNHNTYPIFCRQLANGMMFNGNQIHDGIVQIDTCTNVVIQGGRINVDEYRINGGGLNYIRNNEVGSNYADLITKNGGNTIFVNNQKSDETYLENRSSNNIYIINGSPHIVMTDTVTDIEIAHIDTNAAKYNMPVYCKSKGVGSTPFRLYSSVGSNYLGFMNQTATNDAEWYIRNASNTNMVLLNSNGASYFKGGDLSISAGNVGIGSTAPLTQLNVFGTLAAPSEFRITNTGGTWAGTDTIGKWTFYTSDASVPGRRILAGIYAMNDKGSSQITPSGSLLFKVSPYASYVIDALKINSSGDMTSIYQIYKGSEVSKVPGVMFTQTADKTIANTTTETSAIGAGAGSVTIPANCLIAGKTIRIKMSGYMTANNGVSTTVKVKIGSVELTSSTGTIPKALTSVEWELNFTVTCRTTGTTGTVIGQGGTVIYDGLGITTNYVRPLIMTSTATVNTTVSNAVDATYTWGTADAGNSLTCTNTTIEILN